MDQITKVKTDYRLSQWKQLILERQASGLSVQAWCKQHNLCQGSYYYYLKKLRLQACGGLPSSTRSETSVTFQKLEVQSAVTNTQAAVLIHLPNATLEVCNGANQQTLEAVLSALKSIC